MFIECSSFFHKNRTIHVINNVGGETDCYEWQINQFGLKWAAPEPRRHTRVVTMDGVSETFISCLDWVYFCECFSLLSAVTVKLIPFKFSFLYFHTILYYNTVGNPYLQSFTVDWVEGWGAISALHNVHAADIDSTFSG